MQQGLFNFTFKFLRVNTFILISGGCPWWADGNDAVESRYFISSLIGTIRASGWEVRFSSTFAFESNFNRWYQIILPCRQTIIIPKS